MCETIEQHTNWDKSPRSRRMHSRKRLAGPPGLRCTSASIRQVGTWGGRSWWGRSPTVVIFVSEYSYPSSFLFPVCLFQVRWLGHSIPSQSPPRLHSNSPPSVDWSTRWRGGRSWPSKRFGRGRTSSGSCAFRKKTKRNSVPSAICEALLLRWQVCLWSSSGWHFCCDCDCDCDQQRWGSRSDDHQPEKKKRRRHGGC